MHQEELHVSAEIKDGIEELWVTSETTVIHLSIHVDTGEVRGFSCRLGPGMVAEMGGNRDVKTGHCYPGLFIFTEDGEHRVTSRKYVSKRHGGWIIED